MAANMPLIPLDANAGRQTRSSSDLSAGKKVDYASSKMTHGKHDAISQAPSVLSMLKTTTETGDLGSFTMNQNKLPKLPRPGYPRRGSGNNVAPSHASSHYSRSGSLRSKASSRSMRGQNQPTASQYYQNGKASISELHLPSQDTRSITSHNGGRASASSSTEKLDMDQRSYSLTLGPHTLHHLSNNKSISSLRTQVALQHPQSPHRLSSRSRRPSYRPASPALSDTVTVPQHRSPVERPYPVGRAYTTSPFLPSNLSNAVTVPGPRNLDPLFNTYKGNEIVNRRLAASGKPNLPTHPESPSHHHRLGPRPMPAPGPSPYVRPLNQWRPFPSVPTENGGINYSTPSKSNTEHAAEPYVGFVQRVKSILEEKASSEERRSTSRVRESKMSSLETQENPPPAELSASPVAKRLTRDMIKAAMDTSSDGGQASSQETNEFGSFNPPSEFSKEESGDSAEEISQLQVVTTVLDNPIPESAVSSDLPAQPSSFEQAPNSNSEGDVTDNTPSSHVSKLIQSAQSNLGHSEGADQDNLERGVTEERLWNMECLSKQEKHVSMPEESAGAPSNSDVEVNEEEGGHVQMVEQARPLQVDSCHKSESALGEMRATDMKCNQQPSAASSSSHASSGTKYAVVSTPSTPRQITTPKRINSNIPAKDEGRVGSRVSIPRIYGPASIPWRSSLRSTHALDSLDLMSNSSWNTSTTDLRLSAMKNFQFPLPDLTEDSQEDASTTNLRMLGSKPPIFRHQDTKSPAPERKLQPSPAVELPKTYLGYSLMDTHALPSLQFSRADLTTSLNHALGLRSSRSFENLRRTKSLDESFTMQDRPASSTDLRDRYRSFFSMTEGSKESFEEESLSEEMTFEPRPEDELVTELKRLSIPSVSGLTLRLSELIPTIKKGSSALDITKGDDNVNSTVEEIRELGSPERTGSGHYSHTSFCSASTNMVSEKGKSPANRLTQGYGSAKKDRSPLQLMKDLPPLPSENVDTQCNIALDPDQIPAKALDGEMKEAGPSELEAAVPVRHLSSDIDGIQAVPPLAINNKLKGRSNSMLRSNTPDSRPWNQESNYPWGDGGAPVEMNFPNDNVHDPTDQHRYKIRKSRSTPDLASDDSLHVVRSMSPGPHMDANLIPQTDVFSDFDRTVSKKGIIGSISRKMGIKPRVDKAGFPIDPLFLHPEDRVTEPGDRYPTSGLTPPSGLSIDANRSYFSDDSSDSERANSRPLRKRLTRLKAKRSTIRITSPNTSQGEGHQDSHGPGNDSSVFVDSHVDSSEPDVVILYDQVPAGMSKVEFRAKRVVEKLRTIWYKSGELIRSLSRTKKQPPSRYEGNELYPGV